MSQTKSYFFNAEPTEDLSSHPTGYDREYDADDHAAFFRPFFSEKGIMAGRDADACKVSVQGGEGTTLQVAAGAVYVRGRAAIFDGTETVTVSEDCKIVCRMNKGADVRAFQLLAITGELQDTEDVCDLQLATAHLEEISGGHKVVLTDTRTFLSYMGQPAYYPPDSDSLPYVLWLYTLGFPMDEEQRQMVEGNPSLMAIFNASLGAHTGDKKNPHAVTAEQVGALASSGGVMSGAISMSGHKIANLAAPADSTDAANKQYVDEHAGARVILGSYVGTGKTGKSNPNQITLAEPFKILCIYGMQSNNYYKSIDGYGNGETSNIIHSSIIPTEYTKGISFGFGYRYSSRDSYGKKSTDGKTFSWYFDLTTPDATSEQLNASGTVYYYYAIV